MKVPYLKAPLRRSSAITYCLALACDDRVVINIIWRYVKYPIINLMGSLSPDKPVLHNN